MPSTVPFERPGLDSIIATIRRVFPIVPASDFGLSPDSIARYFEKGGIKLPFERIPDWEAYEWGQRDIADEEFLSLLFSPLRPSQEECITVVTDESFYGPNQLGYHFRFGDLLTFARDVYPQLTSRPMAFFQPSDTIFIAEESKLLVMLHHSGYKTQYSARPST